MTPAGGSGPLSSVRVLDLSGGIRGAYATKLLVDAGAEVILVEPAGGHPMRRWSTSGVLTGDDPVPEGHDGALFAYLCASKRSVHVDPGQDAVSERLLDLVVDAEIVVEDGDGARLRAFGLDVADLHRRNPAVVVVSITDFGTTGPWAERVASEFTLQAMGGSTIKRGQPDREPLHAGGRTGEWLAGAYGALGALAAWWRSRLSGVGDHVDVSTLECIVLGYTVYRTLWESMDPTETRQVRNLEIPSIEPAADAYVGLCTVMGQMWHDFSRLVGHPEWTTDPVLNRWGGRSTRADELRREIAAWLHDKTADEVIETCNLMRIPCVPIGNGALVPTLEHFVERGTFVDNPAGFVQPRRPYLSDSLPLRPIGAAPMIGECTSLPPRAPEASTSDTAGDVAPTAPPLTGLTVTDFSGAIAGSYTAQLLAMLGAEVIKVESTTRIDPARTGSIVPMTDDGWWEHCPLYLAANTDKLGITLDLDQDEGRALARSLIARSDVVLENNSPRVMDQFGFDGPSVSRINPRAVYVRMPAFGLTGPWRDRVGFAQTQEQVSGLAWLTGYRDRQPIIPQGLCDWLSGVHNAFAVLVALVHREQTSHGAVIESPMTETAINIAAEAIVEHSAYGRLLERTGNRGPLAAPQGVYPCKGDDRWVAIAVGDDEQWRRFRAVTQLPGVEDLDLATEQARRRNEDALDDCIATWTRDRTASEVVELLWPAGVAVAEVCGAHELLENPQLRHRRFLERVAHPVAGDHDGYLAMPFRLANGPHEWNRTPAPLLGEHNRYVLTSGLGLTATDVDRLQRAGVIGDRPYGTKAALGARAGR